MMRYNMSEIMKKAWNVRRLTGDSMSDCLKRVWAVEKERVALEEKKKKAEALKARLTVENLTAKGGKLWEKGSYRRVYFNRAEIIDICKIEVEYNKNGTIKKFKINGEESSNSYGSAIMATAKMGIFFDLESRKFCEKYGTKGFDTVVEMLTDAILAA